MIALLNEELGWDIVANELVKRENQFFAHSINLCEVYYDFIKAGLHAGLDDKAAEETASKAIDDLQKIKIMPRTDMDEPFWKQVGQLKAQLRKISLADCHVIALAQTLNAVILTSDRKEFTPVRDAGLCRVEFIR